MVNFWKILIWPKSMPRISSYGQNRFIKGVMTIAESINFCVYSGSIYVKKKQKEMLIQIA